MFFFENGRFEIFTSKDVVWVYRILQCFGSGFIDSGSELTNSGSGSSILDWKPIRIQGFDDKKLKRFTADKKFDFFDKKLQLLIPRPPLRMSKIQEKPSALKREHLAALQNINFLTFFDFSVSFCPPRSGSWFRMDGLGFIDLFKSWSETLLFLHNWLDTGACEPPRIWGAGSGRYGGLPLRPPPGWLLAPGSLPAPPAGMLQVSGLCQHLQLGCFRYQVSASTSSWGACLCEHLQLGCFRYLVSASSSSWDALGIWSLPAPPAAVLQVSGLCQHLQLRCFRYLVSASTSSWGASGIWSLPAPPAGVL